MFINMHFMFSFAYTETKLMTNGFAYPFVYTAKFKEGTQAVSNLFLLDKFRKAFNEVWFWNQ